MGFKVIIQGDDDVILFKWPVEEETAKSLIVTAVGRNAPRPREVQAQKQPETAIQAVPDMCCPSAKQDSDTDGEPP
ncbi:hypothetical protein [Sporomusa aerivorans]|uniref:hypothetical protein n=1 Tax=Sporomusa aerivorans TaxID=204936 RepID=UPI00352ACEDE